MAMEFTQEQRKVIETRNCDLLVSAAAGSGKTAVLVERILGLITDKENPVDIDRLLIVTFTNAAAGEMRERIGQAINERLKEEPENSHLQRQATLLHHAQITTIDSFCLFVIRNNFNEVGLDPGFRVADTGELELLKQDIIKSLFEDLLEKPETKEEFIMLLDTIASGSREKVLEEIILQIHDFAQSFPWPSLWLKQRYEDYATDENGIEGSVWGRLLEDFLRQDFLEIKESLSQGLMMCGEPDGPSLYEEALRSDLEQVEQMLSASWSRQYELMKDLKHIRLSSKKQPHVSEEKKLVVKALRDRVKADIQGLKKKYYAFSPQKVLKQMEEIRELEKVLLDTVIAFRERFAEAKREKNIIDFGDMEHFALDILVKRQEDEGKPAEIVWVPTRTAQDYAGYFQEIMIDEYQDSNLVQEFLLQSISREWQGCPNRFMVGDIKQSIYKFRMARPEIFLEKYRAYQDEGERRCIHLHKNFRSRREVLEGVNSIFYQLMMREVGKIDYTQKEALYPGAVFCEGRDNGVELLLLDKTKENEKKAEAAMVAGKIKDLVENFSVMDRNTGRLRPACYRDIVILLRTNAGWDEVFYQELSGQGIPVMLTGRTGYFNAKEVQVVLNFLRVIDNPRQDIPLYGVMTSLLGRFSREQLARMKKEKGGCLYERLVQTAAGANQQEASKEEVEMAGRAAAFLETINHYRNLVSVMPIHQLLREYLKETGYLYYFMALPGGEQRVANVKMLLKKAEDYEKTSYFGLFHFIRYMEQLQKYEVDTGEAQITDEDRNVVRIMSIHKSKGLEFPICFVSGLNKRFNRMDSRKPCIMDMDMGLALEYRDAKKRIRNADLRKNIIARKIEEESLGEELRILYVAMTRAKEKLILTGVVNDLQKQMLSFLEIENRKEVKLPRWVITHGNSFLDYLLAATVRPCPSLKVKLWDPGEERQKQYGRAIKGQLERLGLEEELLHLQEKIQRGAAEGEEDFSPLKEALSFSYSHSNLQGLYAKTTVSELKKKAMEDPQEADFLFEEPVVVPYLPRFMEEKSQISGAARGTAYHRVLELLDFSRLSDWHGLMEDMAALVEKGILDSSFPPLLQQEKMDRFLQSSLAKRMKEADKKQSLFKEKPFVLGLSATILDKKFPEEEKILIQGIIDAYFEENGELVLVDYKTDRISHPEELIQRYQSQIFYYQMALEQLTGKRVKERYLYSFALGEAINCPATLPVK